MRILICGAAGILGAATRDSFLAAGHRLACIDREAGGTQREGERWFPCPDLADPDAAAASIAAATDWLGGLDGVVQLVGAFDWMKIADSTLADWRGLYRANVETTLAVVQACVPLMTTGGAIVTVGAASAEPAGAGMAPYAAAKSGVARLSEALASELAPQGIRVNAVLPKVIDTPRNRQDMPDADPRDWTRPEAVASVILFLAQPESRAINGASIPVTNPAGGS